MQTNIPYSRTQNDANLWDYYSPRNLVYVVTWGKKSCFKDFCLLNIHNICLVSIQTQSAISENMWEKTKSETTTSENRGSTPNKWAPVLHMAWEHLKLHKYCINQKTQVLKSKWSNQEQRFSQIKIQVAQWKNNRLDNSGHRELEKKFTKLVRKLY